MKTQMSRLPLLLLMPVWVGMILACGGGGNKTPEEKAAQEAEQRREKLKREAADASEDYVRKFLKSPDDASFG